MKHTRGPWEAHRLDLFGKDFGSENENGLKKIGSVCLSHGPNQTKIKEWAENAARIVECVNAFEGVENPEKALTQARNLIALILKEWEAPTEGVHKGELIARLSQYASEARDVLAALGVK